MKTEKGWLCLMLCNIDVLLSIVILHVMSWSDHEFGQNRRVRHGYKVDAHNPARCSKVPFGNDGSGVYQPGIYDGDCTASVLRTQIEGGTMKSRPRLASRMSIRPTSYMAAEVPTGPLTGISVTFEHEQIVEIEMPSPPKRSASSIGKASIITGVDRSRPVESYFDFEKDPSIDKA